MRIDVACPNYSACVSLTCNTLCHSISCERMTENCCRVRQNADAPAGAIQSTSEGLETCRALHSATFVILRSMYTRVCTALLKRKANADSETDSDVQPTKKPRKHKQKKRKHVNKKSNHKKKRHKKQKNVQEPQTSRQPTRKQRLKKKRSIHNTKTSTHSTQSISKNPVKRQKKR